MPKISIHETSDPDVLSASLHGAPDGVSKFVWRIFANGQEVEQVMTSVPSVSHTARFRKQEYHLTVSYSHWLKKSEQSSSKVFLENEGKFIQSHFDSIETYRSLPEWQAARTALSALFAKVRKKHFLTTVAELVLEQFTDAFMEKYKEFPKSSLEDLEKFKNYDEELGWEPRPCGPRPDVGHKVTDKNVEGRATLSIADDGARGHPVHDVELHGQRIEFFGDSSCFCRGANDDETFAYYLEADHGIGPCKNFGVGNYGIDQAYLRAERRMIGGGIAILFMPIGSLYRVSSIYKHYIEIKNAWAVKPRFKLHGKGLKLIPRPFKDRAELADLTPYAKFFEDNDKFRHNFLEKSPAASSHDAAILRQITQNRTVFDKMKREILRKVDIIGIEAVLNHIQEIYVPDRQSPSQKGPYELSKQEESVLFARISRKFTELARSRGSKAFVVVSPQGWGTKSPDQYEEVIAELTRQCATEGVDLFNYGEAMFKLSEEELIRNHAYNIHLSAEGNRHLAGWLAGVIKQYDFDNTSSGASRSAGKV